MKYAALSNPAFTDTCLYYKYGHLIITDSLLSPSLSLLLFFLIKPAQYEHAMNMDNSIVRE